VIDNGVPALSNSVSFSVAVGEVNLAPTLPTIGAQNVNEGATLSLSITATDPDLPANVLTYTLISPPSGASINPTSGAFTWTPTEGSRSRHIPDHRSGERQCFIAID
jgi:hypothetical protein